MLTFPFVEFPPLKRGTKGDFLALSQLPAQKQRPDHDAQDDLPPHQVSKANGEQPADKPDGADTRTRISTSALAFLFIRQLDLPPLLIL